MQATLQIYSLHKSILHGASQIQYFNIWSILEINVHLIKFYYFLTLLKMMSCVMSNIVWNDIVSIKAAWVRRVCGEIDAKTIVV